MCKPIWSDEEGVVVGYMDKVDYECELGAAGKGNTIFPSVEALKKVKPCTIQCGIVKVEVRLREVIQDTDFTKSIEKWKSQAKTISA
jgi:hypothetical protein